MRMKRQASEWEEIFSNYLPNKGLYTESIKKSQNLIMRKQQANFLSGQKICKTHHHRQYTGDE